jgi:hypothetical protein
MGLERVSHLVMLVLLVNLQGAPYLGCHKGCPISSVLINMAHRMSNTQQQIIEQVPCI